MARFIPFAPVGGTMWAAAPARNSRPAPMGSTTKLRMAVMPRSRIGPWLRSAPPSTASRALSSTQMRSSGQASSGSSAADAVEPVAAGDHRRLEPAIDTGVVGERHLGIVGVDAVQPDTTPPLSLTPTQSGNIVAR